MKNKRGISLIVLVITIIVMIILAASVVITLNNSGIIDKANDAVNKTNLKEVQQLASVKWAEEFMDGKRGETLKNAVLEALKDYTDKYDIEVDDQGVLVIEKAEDDGEWINDPTTCNIKFKEPYTINQTIKTGEILEITYVFYEEGVGTLFVNGTHGQTEIYPVFETEYCKNKLRRYPVGMPQEAGYEEYTISANGNNISCQNYVSSSDGDYYETTTYNLTKLEELMYDVPIDVDVTSRKLISALCISNSGTSKQETDSETGEVYNINEIRIGYVPSTNPEYWEEITSYYSGLKALEHTGILEVHFDKENLTLMERDDYGIWDEENYILTLTNEELKNRTTEIYYKFKSNNGSAGSTSFVTSIGGIFYRY